MVARDVGWLCGGLHVGGSVHTSRGVDDAEDDDEGRQGSFEDEEGEEERCRFCVAIAAHKGVDARGLFCGCHVLHRKYPPLSLLLSTNIIYCPFITTVIN